MYRQRFDLSLPTCLYLLMLIQLVCNTAVNSIHTLARCKYTPCLGSCQEQILTKFGISPPCSRIIYQIPGFQCRQGHLNLFTFGGYVTPARQLVPSQPKLPQSHRPTEGSTCLERLANARAAGGGGDVDLVG